MVISKWIDSFHQKVELIRYFNFDHYTQIAEPLHPYLCLGGEVSSLGGSLSRLSGRVLSLGGKRSRLSGSVPFLGGGRSRLGGSVLFLGKIVSRSSGEVPSLGGKRSSLDLIGAAVEIAVIHCSVKVECKSTKLKSAKLTRNTHKWCLQNFFGAIVFIFSSIPPCMI
jgi:hypothetical protein